MIDVEFRLVGVGFLGPGHEKIASGPAKLATKFAGNRTNILLISDSSGGAKVLFREISTPSGVHAHWHR